MLYIGKEEVKRYLSDVKKLVKLKKYYISNRDKNKDLHSKYYIDDLMIEDIIDKLNYTDFCYIDYNNHKGREDELLYIFGKEVLLPRHITNKEEKVSLYIKLNKLDSCFVIVISFHEQEYPLKYIFKN